MLLRGRVKASSPDPAPLYNWSQLLWVGKSAIDAKGADLPRVLWTSLLVELELAFVADPDDHGALDWITFLSEGHITRDAGEFLDLGQRVSDALTIYRQITSDLTAVLNGLLDDEHRIPGQRAYVIRDVAILRFVAIDERLGCAGSALCGIVGAEEKPITFLATEVY